MVFIRVFRGPLLVYQITVTLVAQVVKLKYLKKTLGWGSRRPSYNARKR